MAVHDVNYYKQEAEKYKQGWMRLTQFLRDKQFAHLDKHEGDIYHFCQSAASKFGLRETGPLIGSIDAPNLESTDHPKFEQDPLGYYRAMAVMGTSASYVLENDRFDKNAFHQWISLWEHVSKLPEPMQRLFMEERLLVDFAPTVDETEYDCTFFVQCNDLFYWASADAERIAPEEYPDLLKALDESPENGAELWCARHRKLRPQAPYYKYFSQAEQVLFNEAGPERTDMDGKQ